MKKCLLTLLAAGLIAVAMSFTAAAQDNQSAPSQSTPPSSANDRQGPPSGGMRHGMPDPAEHAQMLAKHLKLSSEQESKVQSILESQRSQMEGLREDTTLSQQDRRSKMMDLHKNTNAQIRGLLDPGQQKKFDEMQARHEMGQGHRHGDSGDQQGPPPPPQP